MTARDPRESPALSVVLAAPSGQECAVHEAVAAVLRSCGGVSAEILVAGANPVAVMDDASGGVGVRRVPAQPGTLVPELWGAGLREARGAVVAFTSDEFRVADTWGATLARAVAGGVSGAGGTITLDPAASPVARAVYLLRYVRFGARDPEASHPVSDIAGDNAAYDRRVLERHADALGDGFWEVEVHRYIRADGGTLMRVPGARTCFVAAPRLGTFARLRYLHGRRFGFHRVRALGQSRWRCVLAAPLVPAVLTLRALRAAWRDGLGLRPWILAIPALVVFAGAWALGEVAGAAVGDR